ncbi:MAG: ankyrin repeat domain-containing protein [Verrucomicrobiota bacterium]|jgi:endogenous inhibitor of DNA gyrase (YacG/DUF329 family)
MSEFLKCECPHCGQSIEYPTEGTGQAVPCPACGKPVTLTPANQPQANDEEPEPPTYLEYLPEPRPDSFSGSDFDNEHAIWCYEIKQTEAENRRRYDEYLTAMEHWISQRNEAEIKEIKPFPESPKSQYVSLRKRISETPSQEITIPCPACEKHVTLTPANPPTEFSSIAIPPAPARVALAPTQKPKEKKRARTNLSKLTEETIRTKTQTGDTPLHRAAKTGRISEIPRHLLTIELFMARNNSFARETPLHLAARYGHLDKVPKEFLTKETLTASTEYEKKESKTGSTPPRTETPLHTAARYGHADQIPKEFLTPEFLSIEAGGYRLTVLHQLAYANRLDLVPDIYANSEMWNLRNSSGQTPRDIVETNIKQEAYVARVRSEPATEKQKEKLRYFGCTFNEKITKGQASDALDKCARDFPEVNRAYYNRPATEEQFAYLRPILKAEGAEPDDYAEPDKPLSYGRAKDLIWECEMEKRQKEEAKFEREMLIDFVARTDFWPGLTRGRAKKAAKVLDENQPGWREDKNASHILHNKVAELNPELAAREGWPTHML